LILGELHPSIILVLGITSIASSSLIVSASVSANSVLNISKGSSISFSLEELPNYNAIKEICGETPLFIGFGIDSYEKVKLVQSLADGAIIGSAYLKALSENKHHKFLNKLSDL
jgi:tryptophan synthase alpha subunit